MAKGFKKDGLDILIWEIFRGTGRQTGRQLSNGLVKEVKKRTIDDKSNFRAHMDRLKMPGTFRGGLSKMNQTIDLFIHEYESTKAVLQKTWYLESDITAIERKLRNLQILVGSDRDEIQFERLVSYWNEVKQEIRNKE
jgi:hypothetical protein